jgi:hypothetical protein
MIYVEDKNLQNKASGCPPMTSVSEFHESDM